MKHHCHCSFAETRKKFRAGKLGAFGGLLVVLHLLYHVAECLVLPAILIAVHRDSAEAAELTDSELRETSFANLAPSMLAPRTVQVSFFESLDYYSLHLP